MNKKVKWSVISATSVTFLTFAGLVTGNVTNKDTNAQIKEEDNFPPDVNIFNDDNRYEYNERDQEEGEHSDAYFGWGDERTFQAPSSGAFTRGHRSSGGSR